MKSLLEWLLTHPAEVVGTIVALLGVVKGGSLLKTIAADRRAQLVMKLAHVAFGAVEEMSRLAPENEPMKGAAKVAAFLDKLDTALEAAGAKPLSDDEKTMATDVASAINAQKEAALRVGPQVALPVA